MTKRNISITLILAAILIFVSTVAYNKTEVDTIRSDQEIHLLDKSFQDEDIIEANSQMTFMMSHAVKLIQVIDTVSMLGEVARYGSSGSGAVLATDINSNTSVVLTVSHVCTPAVEEFSMIQGNLVVSVNQFVITQHGKQLKFTEILYNNPSNDICVVEVEGIAGIPAYVAAFNPERGDRVYSVGAPAGVWDVGIVHLVEGFFVGVKKEKINGTFKNFSQWSMPIVGGMSGSAVFHNGRIVGLISHVHRRFHHIGWGPGIEQVRLASEIGISKWRDRIYGR